MTLNPFSFISSNCNQPKHQRKKEAEHSFLPLLPRRNTKPGIEVEVNASTGLRLRTVDPLVATCSTFPTDAQIKKPKRLFLLLALMCYSWPDLWPHHKDLLNLQRSSFIPLPAAHFPPSLRTSYGQWLRDVFFWEEQHAKSLCIVSMHIAWCSTSGSMIKHHRRLNIICKLKHEALVRIVAQKFSSPGGKQFDNRAVMKDVPFWIQYRWKKNPSWLWTVPQCFMTFPKGKSSVAAAHVWKCSLFSPLAKASHPTLSQICDIAV